MTSIQKPISLISAFDQEWVTERNASCLVYCCSSVATYWQSHFFFLSKELLAEQLIHNNNLLEHRVSQLEWPDQNYTRTTTNMVTQQPHTDWTYWCQKGSTDRTAGKLVNNEAMFEPGSLFSSPLLTPVGCTCLSPSITHLPSVDSYWHTVMLQSKASFHQ